MPKVQINLEDAFRNQRELAQMALQQVADLRETLNQLLPGDDPETGELEPTSVAGPNTGHAW